MKYGKKNTKDKNGGIFSESIIGYPSDKKGYIHESISVYSEFEDKPTKIPSGFKRKNSKKKFGKEYGNSYVCRTKKNKKEKDKLNLKLKDSLDYSKWYKESKKYWLKIKDILKLKAGEELVILPFNRNVLDIPYDTMKKNKSYKAEFFFKSEKDTFIYKGDLKVISKTWGNNDNDSNGLELHIEYKPEFWYPLIDGYLPKTVKDKLFKLLGKKLIRQSSLKILIWDLEDQ